MTNDEFIKEFDDYADRIAARRGRNVFELSDDELNDEYCPGETENPDRMPLDTVLRWLIRKSINAFGNDPNAARKWLFTQHEQLNGRPIDLIHTHSGAVSVFRALPDWHNQQPADMASSTDKNSPLEKLRGSVLKYDRPFDPAANEGDWDSFFNSEGASDDLTRGDQGLPQDREDLE